MQKFYTQTSIYCYSSALASKESFILKHLAIIIVIFKKGSFISMYAKVLYSNIYLSIITIHEVLAPWQVKKAYKKKHRMESRSRLKLFS